MTKQIYFSKKLEIGQLIKDNETNDKYQVIKCVALEWLSEGKNKGFLVTVKRYYEDK